MKYTTKRPTRAVPRSGHAPVAHRSAAVKRVISPAFRRAAGYFFLVPLLIFFWLIFYQNLPDDLNGMDFKPISTTGAIDRTIKIGMIAISCVLIATRWPLARLLVKNINPGLAAFMVLIPLSALWSIDSAATLLRFTTLIAIVLLCFAIPLARWDRQRLQQVALPPVMTILVLSLVIGIFSPESVKEIGTDISLNNSWHGITFQKNQFGTTASIVAILCLHRWLAPGKRSFWTIAGIAIALTCLLLSRSSTSLLGTIVVVFFMVLVMRVPVIKERFSTLVVIATFATILVYALAVQNLIPGVGKLLAPIMEMTGKDMTFSARSVIWDVIKQRSEAAPWLGTGYGAYWTPVPTPSSPSYVFMALMHFYPTSSHNGYLDVLNDMGRVGLICLLAFLVYFVRQALQLMPFDRGQAILYLALLFQQMIDNLSESEWFSRTATCTILILASICLSRALMEQRLSVQPAVSGRRGR
jgi:exopolysaccharide production protein ExoQ